MTRKQELFAEHLVAGYSKLQAAIMAGFSERSAHNAANRMMKDSSVLALIEDKKAVRSLELQKKAEEDWMSPENIAKGFRNIYHRCMESEEVMRWDPVQKRMVPVVDEEGRTVYQFDSNGANRAWENIAKHIGFYELDNSQKTPIINVQINQVNNVYGNGGQEAGNNGELTDPSLLTLLPPSTDE